MRFLLDTNVMSDLIRNPQGRIAERIKVVGEANVCTSIVVAAELRYGATRKASSKLTAQVEAVLGAIDTLAFDAPGDEIYRSIRVQLESAGTPIGGNDLIIAAQAIAFDITLVTDNDREFSRIDGLRIENWLRNQARELISLVRRINRTNASSRLGSGTLADALAERDVLKLRGTAYRELATAASTTQTRTTRSEVKFVSAVSVAAVQRKAGDLAQELRQLDTRIQEADWKTDLID